MNQFGRITLCIALACGLAGTVQAQDYPSRPIHLISPFAPGGGSDLIARFIAQYLSPELGQPIVIENRPGAGGAIGGKILANSPPDGYTLLLASRSPVVITPLIIKNLGYDPSSDFAPVILIGDVPTMLLVRNTSRIHTVQDLIRIAKDEPDKLTFASSGIGGGAHMAGLLLENMTGIKMLHVPFKGTSPATLSVLQGQVTMTFADTISDLYYVQSHQLRAVAVTTPKRIAELPDVPAISETLPGYEAGIWYGIFAPAKTPQAIIDKLNQAMNKLFRDPAIRADLAKFNVTPTGGSVADFVNLVQRDNVRWSKVIHAAGLMPK